MTVAPVLAAVFEAQDVYCYRLHRWLCECYIGRVMVRVRVWVWVRGLVLEWCNGSVSGLSS